MRILIVTESLYPSTLGGQAKTLYWLGQALAQSGCDVDIITSNMSIPEENCLEWDSWHKPEDRLNTYYADISSENGLNLKILPPVIKAIKKYKDREYDILLLCSIFYIPGFEAARFAKKIIWSPRGELFDTAMGGSLVKKIYISFVKHLFGNKTIYHATSMEEEELIKKYFGKRVKTCVIPNLMYVPQMMEHRTESNFLLYVGRLSPIKALDNLIKGLSLSATFVNSDFKMIFVGAKEDKYEKFYQNLIALIDSCGLKERIIFAGTKDGEEKYRLYANAYFSFLVSHSENFGNVVIESLSQGTPVVASHGTPWQSLEINHAGFWVNNNPENISSVIDRILSMNSEEYLLYRKNARVLSEEYDIKKNIGSWIDVLSQH